jgi:hypothetical protein
MKPGLTTEEEIAEIIFNSPDTEMNDMLQKAKTRNYDISQLVWRIAADINGHHSIHLENPNHAPDRNEYLANLIKAELNYYAAWYENKSQ